MILRKISQSFLLYLLLSSAMFFLRQPLAPTAQAGTVGSLQGNYDPYTLIAEVNALRAANGLPALNPDPILMAVSQAHAEYMASVGSVSHYSADGSRPFQRSLAAGYPVAGDLNLGGFHAENIIAGTELTPAEAVSHWTGDEPHLNTMLSPQYKDIGAGVSIVGNKIYYVIDTSRKSGTAAAAYTPQVINGTPAYNLNPLVSTIYPNTPSADGSVIHTVKPGETLWLIAITYGTKIDEILLLNNLPKESTIYPGQILVIKNVVVTLTPTPLAATETPSARASPTFTITVLANQTVPDIASVDAPITVNRSASFVLPLGILLAALAMAALIAFSSGRRKRE